MGQERRRIAGWAVGLAGLALAGALVTPLGPPAAAAPVSARSTGQQQSNFWLATPSGSVYAFGATDYGSPSGPLNQPIVSVVPSADKGGYWMVASDGGVFTYGDTRFFGSTGDIRLNRPIVGLAATPDGNGYWMVASDGGVFTFGDATFYGSTGNIALNQPIVGMATTPDGHGYWLVASDGGVFTFGDATFYGSTGNIVLNQPIASMTTTPDGHGYWLVASDGGVFTFGDAAFYGSSANDPGDPVQHLLPTRSGHGYWIVQQNGTEAAFGDAGRGCRPGHRRAPGGGHARGQGRGLRLPAARQAIRLGWERAGGYDCSGLVLASWSHADGITFARVADDQYHTAGVPVPMTSLRAGDLVFWGYSQTDWTTVYHTAMYIGGNRIVEATGDHVQLNSLGQWGTGDLMPNGRRP